MTEFEKLKEEILGKTKKPAPKRFKGGLSSGLTRVNLECTGDPNVAFVPGHVYLEVGDSQAGKTIEVLTTLAEACLNSAFDKYDLVYDNPERGAQMDLASFFGKNAANRIEPPNKKGHSQSLEEFYYNVDDRVKKSCIYVLDSEDALKTQAELKKFKQDKNSANKVKGDGTEEELKGSYGTDKAKKNSSLLRMAHNSLEKTGSILIIIKQTRDNIGYGAMFNPKTRSGGRALTFFASLEKWYSVVGKIKRTVNGKERTIGSRLRISVKKNRFIGGDGYADVRFYPSFGFDDVGSNVDYLIEEKHWKSNKEKTKVEEATEFGYSGTTEGLIKKIQDEEKEGELKDLVVKVWNDIKQQCAIERKKRYQ